jgi:SulP family sulfate permease
MSHLKFREAAKRMVIDVTHVHFWDITAVSALDKAVIKFRREGAEVEIRGMNDATSTLINRFGVHDKQEEAEN